MQGNLQAAEGFPNISIIHTEIETRSTHPGLPGSFGRGNQRFISAGGRGQGMTNILRQPDAPRGRDEISDDREGGARPGPHGKANVPLFPKSFNHCKDQLPNL